MQLKDYVDIFTSSGGLFVALSAFILSIVLAVQTARSGKADEQRTIRSQLTDTFNQLFATGVQMAQQPGFGSSGNFTQGKYASGMLSQQYASLLGQATFLVSKIEGLVTPVEYNTLAASNANIGEFEMANRYAKKAIEVCDKNDSSFLARLTSSWGTIFYMQSDFDSGNKKFEEALQVVDNAIAPDVSNRARLERNFGHYIKGEIYITWAVYEKQWAAPGGTPDEHFKQAEEEFKAIAIPRNREIALKDLEEVKKEMATRPLPDIGQPQGVQVQQSIFNQMRNPMGSKEP